MEPNTPIAVIGMACRFAGDATSPENLWKLLAEGRSAWSEIPKSRFNVEGVYHPNPEKLNSSNVIGGHFLQEDIGLFDAQFFNLSAEMAAALDPQFRLQLETTYEALESAGITLEDIAGSNTSVFAGAFFRDYHESLIRDPDTLPRYLLIGTGSAMASNRLSHFFDLRGPSMSVDTGCSTTLTALHQGCQTLRSRESDMSIVGGANIILNPDMFVAMSSMTLISKDGKSYAFDSRANGYGRGEGSTTLILKRLDDALRDGDPIRAVIRDTGINQDGKTETITTPSGKAQEELIRACYHRSGLDPAYTTYCEAHGTGTPTGDPIEVEAIASVFMESRTTDQPLVIGSLKTNIGHTETASGLAAIIKVVLALEKGKIPPSINFETPNEKLRLQEWKLRVPTRLESWSGKEGIRRASISNFGYGGSNAHVILEDFNSFLSSIKATTHHITNGATNGNAHANCNSNGHGYADKHTNFDGSTQSKVFILSAKDERAAQRMLQNLLAYLQDREIEGKGEGEFINNLAFTLGSRRSQFPWTTVFSASSVSGLVKTLQQGKLSPMRNTSVPRLGFVFTGQGAQWWAMGRELIDTYPVFKVALLDCGSHLKKLGAQWNMIEELSRDAETSRVNELDYSTAVCVSVQIALVHLLRSWGIKPTAVTSHSSGEIAAAYAAGALNLASAMAIVYARGGLASGMNRQLAVKGGMVAVGLSVADGQKYISRISGGKIAVACENSPSSITVSGDVHGLDQLESLLKQENIFARRLKVDAAWHSHHMEAVADAYLASMENKVRPAQDHLDFIFSSPSTGRRMNAVEDIGAPSHWVSSLTGPVLFVDAFRNMCLDPETGQQSVDMVIEVGPHAALSGPIQDILAMPDMKGIEIPYSSCLVRKRNAVETVHTLVGDLLGNGYPVNLTPVNFPFGTHGLKVVHDLPSYPWNHQIRHWNEPRINKALRARNAPHDLLGSPVLGVNADMPSWRHIIRIDDMPWIRDHVLQGNIVFPAAGYITMALEGMRLHFARRAHGKEIRGYRLQDINILKALLIPETGEGVELQLSLRRCSDRILALQGWTQFCVQSVSDENTWTDHCTGMIRIQEERDADHTHQWISGTKRRRVAILTQGEAKYRRYVDPDDVYAAMRIGGICHGPVFRNIQSIRANGMQSVTEFSVADCKSLMPRHFQHDHIVHPTTLDSVFQAAYTPPGSNEKAYLMSPKVPKSIEHLWISGSIGLQSQPGSLFRAFTELSHIDAQSMKADITVLGRNLCNKADGPPAIAVDGMVYQSIGIAASHEQQPWENNKFAAQVWQPDITLINPAFLKGHLGNPIPTEEAGMLMDLRMACVLYIADALRDLTSSDIKRLEWHQKKFYIWMVLQVHLAKKNGLGPKSHEWLDISPIERHALLENVASSSTNGEMVCRLGRHIVPILRGDLTPLELMLEEGLLSRYYTEGLKWGRANMKLAEMVRLYVHKNPRARIIEVGAGTGGATTHILTALAGTTGAECYDFTDVSSGFFEAAKTKFQDYDFVRYRKLDIEQDPTVQGFEEGRYDVVIACQVLHATKCMEGTMRNCRRLLKEGGKLFIMETTRDQLDIQFVFGFLKGWWLSEEKERRFSPSLTVSMWDRVLRQTGFGGVETEVRDCEDDDLYAFSVMSSTADSSPPSFDFDITFITVTPVCDYQTTLWLDHLKASIGFRTCVIPCVQTLDSIKARESNTVFILLDNPEKPLLSCATDAWFESLKGICSSSKGLLWLTVGDTTECPQPFASLAPGFLRSLRQEYHAKRLATLDFESASDLWSEASVDVLTRVFCQLFDQSSNEPAGDFEYAYRNGAICVPRYVKTMFQQPKIHSERKLEPFIGTERPVRLTVGTPGLLETLAFDEDLSVMEPLPDGVVEIEPRAFGVNFRDVMVAMGQLESHVMGYDCAGIISKVSPAAAQNGHRVGDRVSVLLRGHYSSRPRSHWTSAVKIPDDMCFEIAASLPTQFVTAYVSLYDAARLQKGETILIHSATGGVGQAAVMMAQRVGAEVFVTVGSEAKRNFVIDRFGIPPDHIFSSRDTSFASGLMEATQGGGVDVVLNSLAGSLLQESFDCLAPFGRFVEIGKRDLELNSSLAMKAFSRAVTFSSIDIVALGELKPMEANWVMKEVIQLVSSKELSPVSPITAHPISEVEKAFRSMQTGKHMGKIVLSVSPESLVPVPHAPRTRLRSDASYMVVGGFSGIGRSICRWLVEHGAKNLVVVSRNGGSEERLTALQSELDDVATGVKVTALSCDISDMTELDKALQTCTQAGLPRINGIIHGGMVLRDSVLEHMSLEDHQAALGPKVNGSWNLHRAFPGRDDLDFFIMLSSLVGVFGLTSQSNYSAGGSFQDALATHRVKQGLRGVSIDLGIVKSVGYFAGSAEGKKTIEKLQRHGFMTLDEGDVLDAIDSAIRTPLAGQICLGINTGPGPSKMGFSEESPLKWDMRFSAMKYRERTGQVKDTAVNKAGMGEVGARMSEASSLDEAVGVVVEGITRKLVDIFMISEDDISPSKSLSEFGVDSLVAVELRNMLAHKAGAELSIFDIMQSKSISELARSVVGKSRFVDSAILGGDS